MFLVFSFSVLLKLVLVESTGNETESFDVWQTEKFALYPKLPIALTWAKDEDCRRDSELLLEGLINQTYWAMQMYDSTSSSYGVLHGNIYAIGNYDECVAVKKPIRSHMCPIFINADVTEIPTSNYTPYALDPPYYEIVWKKFKDSRTDHSKIRRDRIGVSLCIPRSCNEEILHEALNQYLKNHFGNAGQGRRAAYNVTIFDDCDDGEPDPIKPDEYTFWAFSSLLVGITILTTIWDMNINQEKKEAKGKRVLMSFSLKRTLSKFIERDGDGGPLDFLYGIKFITIVLIIYDHRCAIFLGAMVFNYQKMEAELRDYNNLFLPHGDLLVDSFFYIAGLLSCYLMLETLKKRYVNPLLVIFGRYMRITPLYMLVVWFYASGVMRLGSGPVWKIGLANESLYCRENWWTNALFINNYVSPERMCAIHAWYLACDFHFFVVTVALVYLLMQNKQWGLGILFTLTVISSFIPAIVATTNHLKPTVIFYHEFLSKPRLDPTYLYLYVKSHTRATVYFIGVISGYYLYTTRASTKKFGVGISMLCNTLGLILLFAPMVYGSQFYHPGRQYSPLEAGLFASLRRLVWAMGCVVIMFTYRFGQIPIIGPLCSSHAMTVLSKLTYAMYLIHFIYQMSDYSMARLPSYVNLFDLFVKGTSDVVASMFYSLILYLIIELPTRSLFKELIFSRETECSKKKTELTSGECNGKKTELNGHDNPICIEVENHAIKSRL